MSFRKWEWSLRGHGRGSHTPARADDVAPWSGVTQAGRGVGGGDDEGVTSASAPSTLTLVFRGRWFGLAVSRLAASIVSSRRTGPVSRRGSASSGRLLRPVDQSKAVSKRSSSRVVLSRFKKAEATTPEGSPPSKGAHKL